MALLQAPWGVTPAYTASASNVASSSCCSPKSQFLVPLIRSSGYKQLVSGATSPTRMSISSSPEDRDAKFELSSPVSNGISSKGKEIADDNFLASAANESAPVICSEQEEFAKEWAHKPRRVVLFVEPSPFSYISGYKNRYQNFIRYLRELGDEVLVVTTHHGAPAEFYGARVVPSWRPFDNVVYLATVLKTQTYKVPHNRCSTAVEVCKGYGELRLREWDAICDIFGCANCVHEKDKTADVN